MTDSGASGSAKRPSGLVRPGPLGLIGVANLYICLGTRLWGTHRMLDGQMNRAMAFELPIDDEFRCCVYPVAPACVELEIWSHGDGLDAPANSELSVRQQLFHRALSIDQMPSIVVF